MGDLISFLGEILSKKINKPVMPSTGLIRLAVKDEFKSNVKVNQLTYEDFQRIFQNSLKKRLEYLGITNLDTIIEELLIELKTNQSLITMMTV